MATVKELLRAENDGTLSFGDYTLPTKTKKDNFEFEGDIAITGKGTIDGGGNNEYREVRLKILKRPMLRLLLQYLHRRMYSSHWNWSRRVSMKY